jgi:MSHA biogenesis protein MshM
VVAGWRGPDVFSLLARLLLWHASRGIPRLANILAHKGLMLAFGRGRHRVGLGLAWAAVHDEIGVASSCGGWLRRWQGAKA